MYQRTRHASLDFPRSNKRLSPQEEWCEFLSASMAALTTDEEEEHDVGSRSLSSIPGLEMRRSGSFFEPLERVQPLNRDDVHGGKPQRRESFSESLTSSTGSSPAGPTWRPLGRRASAHVVPSSNQVEHQLEHGLDSRPLAKSGAASNGVKKTPHSSGFRDKAHVSSSSSSLVESSSSDEEPPDSAENNTPNREVFRSSKGEIDSGFPPPPLSTLAALPESETGNQHILVKSPVLSSRKDAKTWQLQDEELLSSPRLGQFRRSLDESATALFGSGMGLFADDPSHNNQPDPHERRTRTKDVRASSADFTFARPTDFNPPPPPPQEPQLHRLRARSFSYSAGFGSNTYKAPHHPKQYIPQHSQPEFPVTMRQFHAGVPPPPQPVSMMQQGPVRPPRVSIPQPDVHQFQHQNNPPSSYRRYSTDFVAPMYSDHIPQHEPEVALHRAQTGRGIRSYSMEFLQSNQRVRTHSLEGNQMFAPAAPPVEYPIPNRHATGYDWPRSPAGTPLAPPLPPDSRSAQYPPPPPEAYYEVEFKRGRTEIFAGNAGFTPGEYVKVEADRGEDIGRVVRRINDMAKVSSGSGVDSPEEPLGRPKRHDLPGKKIINAANARERELLSEQRKEEHEVFEVCKSKVRQRLLPMNVIDAEYQFDRHKLTFFFEADRRIDFRELVRDLFAIYKTRIWLQQVVPSGKKAMGEMDMN